VNPVETARWTLTTGVRDMTQSDLAGNSERSSEMVIRQAQCLVSTPDEAETLSEGESNRRVDTLVVHAVNVGH
jgi:hypothetical protein